MLRGGPRAVAAPLPLPAIVTRTRGLSAVGRRGGRSVAADRHLRAVGQTYEAGGDDLVAGRHAARHHGLVLVLPLDLDRPHRRLAVVADDVDEGAVRPALHGAGRDHRDALERVDQKPHVDELAGPERHVRVREFRLELDRACRGIDLVVDHGQCAVLDHLVVVRAQRIGGERTLGEGVVDRLDVLLRDIERHRDRLDLGDDDDAAGIGRVDDVADTILAQRLSEVLGVGLVSIQGGQKPAVRIQLDPARMAGYGLSFGGLLLTNGTS